MRTLALALSLSLPLVACGSSAEPPPVTTRAPAPPPASETPPPPPTRAPTPVAAPVPLTDAQRTALTAAIREGRRVAHEGNFVEALASFEAAVAIQPSSSRVRCETAYVAFQAGDVTRAEAHLRVALAGLPQGEIVAPRVRVQTATCLYNAGLIDEARDRFDDARAAYTRSLALRPNATVQSRLDALVARLGPVDPHDVNVGLGPYTRAQSLEQIASAVRDTLCHAGAAGFSPDEMSCDEITTNIARVESTGAIPIEAAILFYDLTVPAGGQESWTVLVVRAGDTVRVERLSEVYSAGIFGMVADTAAAIRASDVLPGGGTEIVVEVSASASDSDMGSCDEYDAGDAATIVCSTDGGTLRCAALPVEAIDTYDHEACADSMDGDGDGDYDEAAQSDVATHEAHGYTLTLRVEGGRAVFGRTPDSRGEAVPPILGDVPIAELLDRSDLRWPDAWTPFAPISG